MIQEITGEDGVTRILDVLRAHLDDIESASTGMSLLKTLAHSDANKRLFCNPAVGASGFMIQVSCAETPCVDDMNFLFGSLLEISFLFSGKP